MSMQQNNPDTRIIVDYATGVRSFMMDLEIPLTRQQCDELREHMESDDREAAFRLLSEVEPEAVPFFRLFLFRRDAMKQLATAA